METKVKGTLRSYLLWPILFAVLNIACGIAVYVVDSSSGQIVLGFAAVTSLVAIGIFVSYYRRLNRSLVNFASEYAHIQRELLNDMVIPYALMDEKGRILWANKSFSSVTGEEKNFYDIFPDVKREELEPGEDSFEICIHAEHEERKYQIDIHEVKFEGGTEKMLFNRDSEDGPGMYAIYLTDETDKLMYIQQLWNQEMVVALVYVDNYDEALESIDEVKRSMLSALVDRKLNKYISSYGGLMRKTEKDKYFAVFTQKFLKKMRDDRFSILEEVKTVNMGNEVAITISMGVGITGDNYNQKFDSARAAIDMALARGGDQAVLKTGEKIEYFGGKSHSTEKYTRVKARVKAHALRELIESKDKVFIMGHQRGDVDSIGAAIGVQRAAKTSGKKAYIVLDQMLPAVKPICDRIAESPDYDEDLFITSMRAKEILDDNSLLVVVDTNRPSYTENPDILRRAKSVVVIDHHRQTREVISNAALSYVEPYASSACEMVAEILQYYADNIKIKTMDADAMYAGIIMDTDNFNTKAGVRTFEAAAFLRRNGADMTKVRKMFRDEFRDYQVRTEAVSKAVLFRQNYAIGKCVGETQENITVVSAQAANELLNIRNVKASFVFSKVENTVYISARSIDEVNVQIVMEQLGGGGHMSVAGAQIADVSIDEAIARLEDVLTNMEENKEI